MYKLSLFIILTSIYSQAFSDPEWYSENIKESDCEKVTYHLSKEMCFSEYYGQQIKHLKEYINLEINNFSVGLNCNRPKAIKDFEELELNTLKAEYEKSECARSADCVGDDCILNYRAANTQYCITDSKIEKLKYLESKVAKGFEITGCKISSTLINKTLKTKKFNIVISADCKSGFYSCDNIIYKGTNKKNKNTITLVGKRLLKKEKYTYTPIGFIFKNKTIHYIVLYSGVLKVIDSTNGKTLLKASGTWK